MNTLTLDSTARTAQMADAAVDEILGYFDRHPAQTQSKTLGHLYQLDACAAKNLTALPEQSGRASYRTALMLWH